ncbi:MAG: hypothetical protein CMA27_06745 [Euryarchaeota archaeon]|nr:hypothetical protein [Euryarchaeota archaeon]
MNDNRTKHIGLGKKINDIDEALEDIRSGLAQTNILSVRNQSHIEELAQLVGVIKSYINYKLNNNTPNISNKTEIEQWAEHLDSMGNSTIEEDARADADIYLGRGGNKKKKTRKKRKRKTKKKRKSRKRKKTKKRRNRRNRRK